MSDDTLYDRRVLPIFIHSEIDDMTTLTPNAMRVYMHLARRADKNGQAWPSYQSIGDHCFISVSENVATRRSFARRAIDELLAAGLIRKQNRVSEEGDATSNVYELLNPVPIGTPMPNKQGGVLNKHTGVPIGTKDTPLEGSPIEGSPMKETATTAVAAAKPDVVWTAWTDTMPGTLTPYLIGQIEELREEYNDREIVSAICIAGDARKYELRYVKGVLRKGVDSKKPAPMDEQKAAVARTTARISLEAARTAERLGYSYAERKPQ
jgi:hypothetical protein